jgi:hypothetical protein
MKLEYVLKLDRTQLEQFKGMCKEVAEDQAHTLPLEACIFVEIGLLANKKFEKGHTKNKLKLCSSQAYALIYVLNWFVFTDDYYEMLSRLIIEQLDYQDKN